MREGRRNLSPIFRLTAARAKHSLVMRVSFFFVAARRNNKTIISITMQCRRFCGDGPSIHTPPPLPSPCSRGSRHYLTIFGNITSVRDDNGGGKRRISWAHFVYECVRACVRCGLGVRGLAGWVFAESKERAVELILWRTVPASGGVPRRRRRCLRCTEPSARFCGRVCVCICVCRAAYRRNGAGEPGPVSHVCVCTRHWSSCGR